MRFWGLSQILVVQTFHMYTSVRYTCVTPSCHYIMRASTLILANTPGGFPSAFRPLVSSERIRTCLTRLCLLSDLHDSFGWPAFQAILLPCSLRPIFRPVIHTKQVFASGVVAVDFSLDSTVTCSHAGVPLLLVAIKPIVRVSLRFNACASAYCSPWPGSPFLPSRRLRSSSRRLRSSFRSPFRSPYVLLSVLPPLSGCS